MRNSPERTAWTILGASFALFCLLVSGVPLAVRAYLLSSTTDETASMQVIAGTVLVQEPNGSAPIGVTASAQGWELTPGDEMLTDSSSWATLDLFDRSSAILYSNTQAKLVKSHAPRFGVSKAPNKIVLDLTGGLMRVGVALPGTRSTEFRVLTPHTEIVLGEGSYRIEVANEGTQLTVARGQALVGRDGAQTAVPQGTRTSVDLAGVASEPVPAERNLITNGDFQEPLATGWTTSTVAYPPTIQPPTVEVVESTGRNAVRFLRREPDNGKHTEVATVQQLNVDARDFTRLVLSLDVMLNFQSLSGGGQLSSEYPVQVRLDYKDRWGNDKFWTHGFYYQNEAGYPIALDPWGQPFGEQIPPSVWYPFESGNLLEMLGENGPAHLTALTIYASGWNYEGLVSEVQLIAE
jgi:hypothetical protein